MSSGTQIVTHRGKGSLQKEISLKWPTVTNFLKWQSWTSMDFKVWRVRQLYHTPSKIGLKATLPKAFLSSDI